MRDNIFYKLLSLFLPTQVNIVRNIFIDKKNRCANMPNHLIKLSNCAN